MTQHTMNIGNGYVTYSTVDLVFEFEGRECFMEFHRYCGPFFYWERSDEEIEDHYNRTGKCLSKEEEIPADDSPRFDPLWDAFNEWNDAQQSEKDVKVCCTCSAYCSCECICGVWDDTDCDCTY